MAKREFKPTGWWRFYVRDIWATGWSALKAIIIVEATFGVLAFLAWMFMRYTSDLTDGQIAEKSLGWTQVIPSWVFLTVTILIFLHLLSAANLAAFHKIERKVFDIEGERDGLNDIIEEQRDPHRKTLEYLRGVRQKVEHFFQGRECEKRWPECARVLTLTMQDAHEHGLYERAECSEERVALRSAKDDPEKTFRHLFSMMKRVRTIPQPDMRDYSEAVPKFQQFLLEDIDKAIRFHEEQLRD